VIDKGFLTSLEIFKFYKDEIKFRPVHILELRNLTKFTKSYVISATWDDNYKNVEMFFTVTICKGGWS